MKKSPIVENSLPVVIWEVGSGPELMFLDIPPSIKDMLLNVEFRAAKSHKYCFIATGALSCGGSCRGMKDVIIVLNRLCCNEGFIGFSPLCFDNVWDDMEAELVAAAAKDCPPRKELH